MGDAHNLKNNNLFNNLLLNNIPIYDYVCRHVKHVTNSKVKQMIYNKI